MANDKKILRREAKKHRDGLDVSYRQYCAEQILQHLCQRDDYEQVKKVFLFSSIGSEPQTQQWAERFRWDGKITYYPRTLPGGVMEFYRVDHPDELEEGRFGIQEPIDSCVRGNPDAGDWVLTPGLIFDIKGYRIGYGGGFYDRYMERFPEATYIGVAYEVQKTNKELPRDEFDRPLHAIVTEMGTTNY